jgi:hypothetical protein
MYLGDVDIVHIGPSAKMAGDNQKKYLGRTSQEAPRAPAPSTTSRSAPPGCATCFFIFKPRKSSLPSAARTARRCSSSSSSIPNGIKIELNYNAAEAEGIAPELMASDLIKTS